MSIDIVEVEQRQQARLYLFLIPHWGQVEVIVTVYALDINSTEGGKYYARSTPSYISRTDRL